MSSKMDQKRYIAILARGRRQHLSDTRKRNFVKPKRFCLSLKREKPGLPNSSLCLRQVVDLPNHIDVTKDAATNRKQLKRKCKTTTSVSSCYLCIFLQSHTFDVHLLGPSRCGCFLLACFQSFCGRMSVQFPGPFGHPVRSCARLGHEPTCSLRL